MNQLAVERALGYGIAFTPQNMVRKSLGNYFRSWFHAGEERATAKYAKRCWMLLLLESCVFAGFFLLVREVRWPIVVIMGIALPRTLAEGRRAVIFTEVEIIYRPPFGQPRRVPIAAVRALRVCQVVVTYFARPSRRPGVAITLADGTREVWPLDFEEHDEILRRLSALTGKAAEA